MNALLTEFPDDTEQGFLVPDFDWEAHGVHVPYVIFITGRCGSTLLSGMVKDTGLAGAPEEFFNEGYIATYSKGLQSKAFASYFSMVAEKYSSNWRFGFEIDWYRLKSFAKLVDVSNVFVRRRSAFYYMTRRDIVAQAWSYATAKATGVWHSYENQAAGAAKQEAPVLSNEAIWREILILLESERQMEAFFLAHGISPQRIDYEMFISNKRAVLCQLLMGVGCSRDAVLEATSNVTERTSRLGGANFGAMLEFRERFTILLNELHNLRGGAFLGIKDRLREEHGLTL